MYLCVTAGIFVIFGCLGSSEGKYAFAVWDNDKPVVTVTDYFADIPKVFVAKATYSNEINQTGWAFLELHTCRDCSDEKQAYAAGYLEGYLTQDLIWMHWQNMLKGYCYNKTDVCGLIEEYIDKNEDYIAEMVQKHPDDPYWYQMKLYYIQLEGLAVGYNAATTDVFQWLTIRDILWINMMGDLDELAFALSLPNLGADGVTLFPDHCTGLVKLLPDLTNLYTSQVTWNSYQSMLRFQKMYVLNYKMTPKSKNLIPGRKMSLSSYPAFIQSTDDFYIISSGLVAGETTIGNSNRTLFELVQPVGQILEYARVMVANRLARSGEEWVEIFQKHNSGTYNNQWYIVDYNMFKPCTKQQAAVIKPGLLWVVEQLPGYTEAADLTEELKRETYFPSYNIPYFPTVFNMSGGNERVAAFGDWFGYHTNPRAKIVKEKQAGIHNLRDMYHAMRYNDFKHDPLSRCEACNPPYSACNAIAARNDLNPANGTFPFRALGHRSHGATDAKITSAYLRSTYQFVAVASPTHNISRGIPPFSWSQFDMGRTVSHVGHPDTWLFSPMLHQWEWG
ncbi:putative phospholipase B-like 2 [Pectinophora gossypiella]|uniref:putative phospholipase B-like 2 n=1 Tax=Pectinophora gossypiella TaxID=13191 RepID=UPI00214E98C4|nr:putative phospholipase B-like 2 [Pectinophora gossypiella]